MAYRCLKNQIFSNGLYKLISLRIDDIYAIKDWRNDQLSILRQTEILTDEMQDHYFQTIIAPSFIQQKPSQLLFSYLLENECIGYGGIVHLDWASLHGEVSFLLETQRAGNPSDYKQDFEIFLNLIKVAAFDDLKLHRLYTETFDIRALHVQILENQGFALEGRMKDHILMKDRFIDSLIHGCLANG